MDKKITFVYLMGRGHSGSTVLDGLLGNGGDVESVGELVSGIGRHREEICSCGVNFLECDFWKQVRSEYESESNIPWDQAAAISVSQAHIGKFVKTMTASKDSLWVQNLRNLTNGIVNAISRVSGKCFVVDSSKEHTRALFLARFMPNSKIIYLVRNPEGVLSSYYYRIRKGRPFKFLRRHYYPNHLTFLALLITAISWTAGNILAEIVAVHAPQRVIRVRYEDLCENPERELLRLEKFIGCNLRPTIEAVKKNWPIDIGHNIGGNEMRMSRTFIFDPKARQRRFLPMTYKIMARINTWPLMLRHGYSLFGGFKTS